LSNGAGTKAWCLKLGVAWASSLPAGFCFLTGL
jgi:hypothetical protein